MTIFSAYIHIPFCRRRCYYCDFPITVLGGKATANTSVWIKEYIDVLCQEIFITSNIGNGLLQTVFFGGGTPSLLPVAELGRILDTLARHFGIAKDAEISLEIDPGTFTLQKLKGYQNLGINRVSVGVQAFQDRLLQVCGRTHSVSDTFHAIDLIHQVDMSNWSMDLISGLPHQTLTDWEFSLKGAINLKPKHLSCYDLVLEPLTAFGKKYQGGENPLPPDEVSANMYRLASKMLQDAGFLHYEISNYAQGGYQCRHNQVYWNNQPYYGFGMGAASYMHRLRFTRPRKRKEYFAWVEELAKTGGKFELRSENNTDVLLETLMLGLRLGEGVSLRKIGRQFGDEVVKQIVTCVTPYLDLGWVVWSENRDYLKLTDPEGFLYSNVVLSALFAQF